MGSQLGRQHAGVLDDAGLRHLVGHSPAVAPAPHAGLRRDSDDLASLTPLAHRLSHLLATENGTRQVDLHQVAVRLLRRPRGALVRVGGQVSGGIGYQDIDTAELGHGRLHHRCHPVEIGYVRFDAERAPSKGLDLGRHGSSRQLLSEFDRRIQPDVVDDDGGAQPGQMQNIGASEASGPTGHQGDFALEFRLIHRSPVSFRPQSLLQSRENAELGGKLSLSALIEKIR